MRIRVSVLGWSYVVSVTSKSGLGINSNTFMYVSDAHYNCRRWLDHYVVTEAALRTKVNVNIKYDAFWSDHLPLQLTCDLQVLKPKIV